MPDEVVIPEDLRQGPEERALCRRNGREYRGPIDKCISWNIDTLKSVKPDKDIVPLPPGRLESYLFVAASPGYSFVGLQGHRWQYTGALRGAVSGHFVLVAGAKRQGAPEGLILAFDPSWKRESSSGQVVALAGRIQLVRYSHLSSHTGHVFVNCLAPGNDHPLALRERFYFHLDRVLRPLPSRALKTVIGGSNPHLGVEASLPRIQAYGYDIGENENGALFRRFVLEHDFIVLNRQGPKERAGIRTATHENGHVLDFAMRERRAHFAQRDACRLASQFPFRTSSVEYDHVPSHWAAQRTELVQSGRRAQWGAKRRRMDECELPVLWDKKKLARDIELARRATLDPKPGEEPVEIPEAVVALRKDVLARLQAAGDFPRGCVDQTHFVLDPIIRDAGRTDYTKVPNRARRLWMQRSTLYLVQDKQEATLSALAYWTVMCPVWWVALAWAQLCPMGTMQFIDNVRSSFVLTLWKWAAKEQNLMRRVEEAITKDRIEAYQKLAQKAEEADQRGDIKTVFEIIGMMAPRRRPAAGALRDEHGAYCYDRQTEFGVWCQEKETRDGEGEGDEYPF